MGTKNNPGRYDCYNNAEPDEPIFTLRGNDPTAGQTIRNWIELNRGTSSPEKLAEAEKCAQEMEDWQQERCGHDIAEREYRTEDGEYPNG